MSDLGDVIGAAASGPLSGIAAITKAARDIIGEFVTDPTKKLEAQQHMLDLAQQMQMAELQAQTANVEAASQNILHDGLGGVRKAFGYAFVTLLIWDYAVVPLLHKTAIDVPGSYVLAFTTLLLGTSAMNLAQKVSAMPGDSSVSVLGVKVGNKS